MPLKHPICLHQFLLSRLHPIEYASLQIATIWASEEPENSEVWVQRTQGQATETDNGKGGEFWIGGKAPK